MKWRVNNEGLNGVSTQNFTIICIENIHFTDDDLTWNNANFEGKISGSLKENPNILARYKDTVYAINRPNHRITTDLFANSSINYEAKQIYYNALHNDFYYETSDITNNQMIESNFLTNDPVDGPQKVNVTFPNGQTSSKPEFSLYPTFTRFKVPLNTKKNNNQRYIIQRRYFSKVVEKS